MSAGLYQRHAPELPLPVSRMSFLPGQQCRPTDILIGPARK